MYNLSLVSKVLLRAIILTFCLFIWTNSILAQDNKIRFEHITQDQGLSSNAIRSILQDHQGFLWIGTESGLNRYDGQIKTYQYPKTFPARSAVSLYEDKFGTLWVGTPDSGLLKYYREQDIFVKVDLTSLKLLRNPAIIEIYEDKQSILWLATDVGLIKFNPKNNEISLCLTAIDPVTKVTEPIFSILEDNQNNFWVSISSRICLFDRNTNKIIETIFLKSNFLEFYSSSKALISDFDGNLLIGTNKGLYKLNTKTKNLVLHEALTVGQITSLFLSDDHILWVGTRDLGLVKVDLSKNQTTYYKNDPKDASSLAGISISTVYQDRSKMLWIGDHSYGISTLSPYKNRFRLYRNNPFDENSIVNNYIRGMCEDSEGSIWVASQLSGLSKINPQTGQITCYKNNPQDPKSLPKAEVWNIYRDKKGTLWVSMFPSNDLQETFKMDFHLKCIPFSLDKDTKVNLTYFTTVICEDHKGRMWFGNERGLYILGADGKSLDLYKNNDFIINVEEPVQAIYEDSNGNIWVGLIDSILKFNPEKNSFVRYKQEVFSNKTNNIYVCGFLEDENKKIWIATKGEGLFYFDPYTNKFTNITEREGLPNNNTYGILEDSQNTLWISTDNGISHYKPQTKEFENFGVADGLQGKEFNRRAFFKSSKGEMFFGGTNGLNAFYPEEIRKNTTPPEIMITEILAVGVPIFLTNKNNVLELDYTQKSLTFKVAAVDFNAPENNLYSYKLNGFDKDWILIHGQKDITYTNLDPGTYTFQVKGTNNHQVWSLNIAEVKIIIFPPPWRSNLAYFIYILTIFTGIFTILKYQANKLKLQASIRENKLKAETAILEAKALEREAQAAKLQTETLEREAQVAKLQAEVLERENLQRIENERQVRQRNLELEEANLKLKEVNEMKASFVAMLVHDLKAPLTAVDLTLESLLDQQNDPETVNMITDSEHSVRKIVSLVNEMLEFYQTDSQEMKFDFSPTEPLEVLRYCLQIAKISASQKNIKIDFQVKDPLPVIFADASKLERVFSNLLSNAIKFTPNNGQILVKVWVEKGIGVEAGLTLMHISITDTGEGIALEELPYIFEPYRQARSSNKRSGVGLGLAIVKRIIAAHSGNILVNSQPGVGTCFTVTLPMLKTEETKKPKETNKAKDEEVKELTKLDSNDLDKSVEIDINNLKKILIVEDDIISQTLLAKKLKKAGYQIDIANNGVEAVNLCLETSYDLILMDYYMPEKDGLEATKDIRSQENPNKFTPIIAITGKAQQTIEEESKKAGINDFIEKPFNLKKIEQIIQQWLTIHNTK